MPKIIHDKYTKHPKMDLEMIYFEKRNIYEAIHQKPSKKDVYESDMQNIHYLIEGYTSKQI